MYAYVHGGDIYTHKTTADGRAFVDFSANINPLGLPAGVKEALKRAVKQCVNYPDPFCRELRQALAVFLKTKEEYLFFGNGASDVLFRLALALQPRRALLLAPTFADYEKALRTAGCRISYHKLFVANGFKVQPGIVRQITPRTELVVLCNPNNPTGQLTDAPLLLEILAQCRRVGARLLVDECFMDFVEREHACSLLGYLAESPELIILKAFTKIFAMPGIRLGYCLCSSAELHNKLWESGQDWSVSVPAQEAGKAALAEKEYLHASTMLVREERAYLISQLRALGAEVYGSEANYVFFRMERPRNLAELLRLQGYLIRSCGNYRNLDGYCYRVAVKTRVLNRGLIKAIKEARKNALVTGTY